MSAEYCREPLCSCPSATAYRDGATDERERIRLALMREAARLGYSPDEIYVLALPHLGERLADLLRQDGDTP